MTHDTVVIVRFIAYIVTSCNPDHLHIGFTTGTVNTVVFWSQLSWLQLWCSISQHCAHCVLSPTVYRYITVHLTMLLDVSNDST